MLSKEGYTTRETSPAWGGIDMAKRSRQFEIDDDLWHGLTTLKKRYNKPMKHIAKTIFDNSDLQKLDEILGVKDRKCKKQ